MTQCYVDPGRWGFVVRVSSPLGLILSPAFSNLMSLISVSLVPAIEFLRSGEQFSTNRSEAKEHSNKKGHVQTEINLWLTRVSTATKIVDIQGNNGNIGNHSKCGNTGKR